MKELKTIITELANMELKEANRKHGGFHSAHEGYAVLLEEVDEAKHDLDRIGSHMLFIWKDVMENDSVSFNARTIKDHAINLAAEAVQVAAMADKLLQFQEEKK